MHLADVHRIVHRTEFLAVRSFGGEVAGAVGVIVVIAHHRPEGEIETFDGLFALGDCPFVHIPVLIPGEITQVEAIDFRCRGVVGVGEFLDKPVRELRIVLGGVPVGQVHVCGYQQREIVIRDGLELEVDSFDRRCTLGAGMPELGNGLVGGNFVAGGLDDERQAVAFVGCEPIVTVGVGGGDSVAVGNQNVFDALTSIMDYTLDRGARLVWDGVVQREGKFCGTERLLLVTAAEGKFAIAVYGRLRNPEPEGLVICLCYGSGKFPPPLASGSVRRMR